MDFSYLKSFLFFNDSATFNGFLKIATIKKFFGKNSIHDSKHKINLGSLIAAPKVWLCKSSETLISICFPMSLVIEIFSGTLSHDPLLLDSVSCVSPKNLSFSQCPRRKIFCKIIWAFCSKNMFFLVFSVGTTVLSLKVYLRMACYCLYRSLTPLNVQNWRKIKIGAKLTHTVPLQYPPWGSI